MSKTATEISKELKDAQHDINKILRDLENRIGLDIYVKCTVENGQHGVNITANIRAK